MMRILCLVGLSVLAAGAVWAGESEIGRGRPHGLGVIVGEPTGVTGKHYITPQRNAIDWAVGTGFINGTALHIHGDYLWEFAPLVTDPDFDLRWYAGPGVRLRFRNGRDKDDKDDVDFGPRGVIGLSMQLATWPTEFFGELSLGVDLINPKATFDIAIGARFYFQ